MESIACAGFVLLLEPSWAELVVPQALIPMCTAESQAGRL